MPRTAGVRSRCPRRRRGHGRRTSLPGCRGTARSSRRSIRMTFRPPAVSSRYSNAQVESANSSRSRSWTVKARRTFSSVGWSTDLGLGSTAPTVDVAAIARRNAGRSESRCVMISVVTCSPAGNRVVICRKKASSRALSGLSTATPPGVPLVMPRGRTRRSRRPAPACGLACRCEGRPGAASPRPHGRGRGRRGW